MVFCLRLFPRKLEKKVFSNTTILKSKDFMIDIPLLKGKGKFYAISSDSVRWFFKISAVKRCGFIVKTFAVYCRSIYSKATCFHFSIELLWTLITCNSIKWIHHEVFIMLLLLTLYIILITWKWFDC